MTKTVIDLKLSEGIWDIAWVEVVDSRTRQPVPFEMLGSPPNAIAVDEELAAWVTIRMVPQPRAVAQPPAVPDKILTELIGRLRLEAGRSGTVEVLKLLKDVPVYDLQPNLPEPLPMFFQGAWQEILDLLLAEADKA